MGWYEDMFGICGFGIGLVCVCMCCLGVGLVFCGFGICLICGYSVGLVF